MTLLADQKGADVRRHLATIDAELDAWRQLSAPGQPYRKHHSQIHRVGGQIDAFSDELRNQLDLPGADPLADGGALEQASLELHRLWEFFRSKLAQRSIARYRGYLDAADEFAWACYTPARDRAVASGHIADTAVTEPPLVFFNGLRSPVTMQRDRAFQAEDPLGGQAISTAKITALLQRLPVPVIGIPWYQIAHMPEVVLLGHEVGHNIEEDLNLTPGLQALLATALKNVDVARRPAWTAWLSEIFADLYGVLASGAAFVTALQRFLSASRTAIAAESRPPPRWTAYPTATLRVRICVHALSRLGFKVEAEKIKTTWEAEYGQAHAMTAYDDDVKWVVDALLDGPYPDLKNLVTGISPSLADVISFGSAKAASLEQKKMLFQNIVPSSPDVRVLVVAASLAHAEQPDLYAKNNSDQVLMAKIAKLRTDEVRSGAAKVPSVAELDRKNGQLIWTEVWNEIKKPREVPPGAGDDAEETSG
jgi:hypothetical protein